MKVTDRIKVDKVKVTDRIKVDKVKVSMATNPVKVIDTLKDVNKDKMVSKAKVTIDKVKVTEKVKVAEPNNGTVKTYQITKDEIDDLEEYILPSNGKELVKLAREGRDRDERTALMLILDWKCVKSHVNSFSSEDFQPVLQTIRKLVDAGADVQHQDRYQKTAAHYLAEWRFTKEKVNVRNIVLHPHTPFV